MSNESFNNENEKSNILLNENYVVKNQNTEKKVVRINNNTVTDSASIGSGGYSNNLRENSNSVKSNLRKRSYNINPNEKFDEGLKFTEAIRNKLKKDFNIEHNTNPHLNEEDTKKFEELEKELMDQLEQNNNNNNHNHRKVTEDDVLHNKENNHVNKLKPPRSKSVNSSVFSEISNDERTRVLDNKKEKLVNKTHTN